MRGSTLLILGLALLATTAASAEPTPVVERDAARSFDQLTDGFLDWYYAANPVRATSLGIHRYDARLASFTAQAVKRRIAALHGWLAELDTIERSALEGTAYYDYLILDHAIRSELLSLEKIQYWRHNPMSYTGHIAWGLAGLVDREFAPVAERMAAMTSRLKQVPLVLASARKNLTDVPPLWVELATRSTEGLATFLQDSVPAAFEAQGMDQVGDAQVEAWRAALGVAVGALEDHVTWLTEELAPRADGDFRMGKAVFERKVQLDEFVDFSAEKLRLINQRAIERYKNWVAKVAAKIDPQASPAEVMSEITNNYPSPDELLPTAEQYVQQAHDFIIEHDILTLPSDRMPNVRETPPYARMGFASMSTPGPFEDNATQAYYNITNVLPGWSDEKKSQHLTYFNYPALLGISVHEAFPGHFVQLLYEEQLPTELRKVFTPASLVEGWAHYAEQMMVDEGLGGGKPEIRLAQLRRALQRHARWYAGLSMHAFGNTIEEATEHYQQIAYFAHFPALREVKRGTYNPTYLYYALGRMQILALREEYKEYQESQGKEFTLKEFHDRFLKLGLPVTLAYQVMVPNAEGPLLEVPES